MLTLLEDMIIFIRMWAFSGQEKTKNVTCIGMSVAAATDVVDRDVAVVVAAIVLSKTLVLEEAVFLGSLMIKKLRVI